MPYTTPFAYQNRFAGTIADILGRQGDIAAQRALGQGQASAQMWANAGQAVSNAVGQVTQYQLQEPQRKLQALQLQEAEQAAGARTALNDVLKNTPRVQRQGMSLYDTQTIGAELSKRGFGAQAASVVKELEGINASFMATTQSKLALVARGAQALLQTGGDPTLTAAFMDDLERNGIFSAQELAPYRQVMQADPAKAPMILRQFAGPAKLGEAAPGATIYDESTGQPMFRAADRVTFGQPQAVTVADGSTRFLAQGSDGNLYENGKPYAGPQVTGLAARQSTTPKTMDQLMSEAYQRGDMAEVARIRAQIAMTKASERAPEKPDTEFLRNPQTGQQILVDKRDVAQINELLRNGWQKNDPVAVRNQVDLAQQNQVKLDRANTAIATIEQLVQFDRGANGALTVKGTHPGFNGVFGTFDANTPTVRSTVATAGALVDQIVSLATLPEMQSLRGLGPASDRDVAIVQNGATILRNRNIGEADALREVQRIYEAMLRLRDTASKSGVSVPGLTSGGTPSTPAAPAPGANPFRRK